MDDIPFWWNLDTELAKVIAMRLREFVANSAGHPDNMTEEQFKEKINAIATKLESYSKRFDHDLAKEQFLAREGQQALHALADLFPLLWD